MQPLNNKQIIITYFFICLLTYGGIFNSMIVHAETAPNQTIHSTALTIYKDGALLRQGRSLPLSKGKTTIPITGIANTIIQESLMLLLSALPKEAVIDETTLSKLNDEAYTLNLLVNSTVDEPKSFATLIYLFKNISWKPFYTIQFVSGYQQLIVNSFFEINNISGISFKEAQVQFVDGNIPPIRPTETNKDNLKIKGYTYKGILDLPKNGTKRLTWATSDSIKTKQDYRVFVGGEFLNNMDGKVAKPIVETWVSFNNTASNTLGQDLPQGPAILYLDQNGQLESLGSTILPHTAVGQEISVRVPSTHVEKNDKNSDKGLKFIETELEQNQFRRLNDTQNTESHYRLELKNKSASPITIRVTLDLPENVTNWEIIRETQPHETSGEKQVFWHVKVPANGQTQLKYQLRFITK